MLRIQVPTGVWIGAVVLAVLLPFGSARAGDPFAIQNNLQDLDHQGESIRSVRIPVNITLRDWQDRPFGLRLRLAGTFATSDLYDVLDGDFGKISMSSFMPGMEFVIPVGENHLLRPHADVGVGFASSVDQAEFLASIGLRTELVFAGQHYFVGLEPGFLLSNRASVDPQNDLIFSPFMTVSGRRVLGFTIDGHQPDAGVFVETGYDFNALEFTSVRAVENATRVQYEVGVGFGFSQSQPKVWFFRIPRVRVGYRFGDLEGWRVRIGGDWLNSVVGLGRVGKD